MHASEGSHPSLPLVLIVLVSILIIGILKIAFHDSGRMEPLPLGPVRELTAEMPRSGFVQGMKDKTVYLSGHDLNEPIEYHKVDPRTHGAFYREVGGQMVTVIALGLDERQHAANAFLLHFKPAEGGNLWAPMNYVAEWMRYANDENLFEGGFREIWLTSRQAYRYLRGDCEDHAILLADWLVELGYDARVVAGKYKNSGHAWVVIFKEGNVYIIEATDKGRKRLLPLAKHSPDYHPKFMFNHDYLWWNTGSPMTTDYEGGQWQIISSFQAR